MRKKLINLINVKKTYLKYPEMELNQQTLDQPLFLGKPQKYMICSTPRTGSFLLCRLLINAGLGIPHEYLNRIHIKILAKRFNSELNSNDL